MCLERKMDLVTTFFDDVTVEDIVSVKGGLKVQLLLSFIVSVFWFFGLKLLKNALKKFIDPKPWKQQFIDLNKKTWEEGFQVFYDSDEEWYDFSLSVPPVLVQHWVGALFCAPAVFGGLGFLSPEACGALARFGALQEVGWEIEDTVERVSMYFYDYEDWKKKNPTGIIVILSLHHVLGMLCVIPMNIYFGDNTLYHEAVFLLQGVAAISLALQNFSYTLDVKKPSDLLQMKMTMVLCMTIVLYSRMFRFVPLCYELAMFIGNQGHQELFYVGCIGAISMGLFNIALSLDAFGKFMKFHPFVTTEKFIAKAKMN